MNNNFTENKYSGKVLFVDDNKVNQLIGKILLGQLGFTVDIAVNGTQAITMCQDNTYSLILMDMEMPLLNGVEASTIIRKKEISFAPIIALTANEGSDVLEKCKKAHMNGYMRKPLDIDILTKELGKIF